jgi:hypothetical protein
LEEAAWKVKGMFDYCGGHGEPRCPSGADVAKAIRELKGKP